MTWLLTLYFASGITATWPQPYASREACEIAASITERRIAVAEQLTPAPDRLAYAGCVAADGGKHP